MDCGQPEVSDDKPEFAPGDFVWGKLKNKQWWPGQVQLQDSASAEQKPQHQQDSTPIRVVFFGKSVEASQSSGQFKPFVSEFGNSIVASSFTRKTGYGRGAGFSGAVTKAAGELRRCVEFGLSCRCVTKGTDDRDPIRPRVNCGLGFGEVEEFLRLLYGAASGAGRVDLVEASVMQGRLAAYLRWVGRLDRPLPDYHQCDGIEDLGVSEEKLKKRRSPKKERTMEDLISHTVETPAKKRDAEEGGGDQRGRRSRKKSKYLSPPYTLMERNKKNSNNNDSTNSSKATDLLVSEDESKAIVPYETPPAGDSSNPNPSRKRTRRRKKFVLVDDVPTNQLLSEFQSLALDTSSLPSEKMVRGFFNEFRSSVYVDGSDYENYSSKKMETPQVLNVDINTPIAVADVDSSLNHLNQPNGVEVGSESKSKRARKKKKSISCELADVSPPAIASAGTGDEVECLENEKKKRRGRKKKTPTTTIPSTTTAIVVSPQRNPKPPLNFVQKSLEKMITTLKNSSGEREKLAEEMSGLLIKVNKMLSSAAADVKDSTTTATATPTSTAAAT